MALKILHTADWHLGRRFDTFDDRDQPKLTRARLDVVEQILNRADSYRVDAVLCAGDLFDTPTPQPRWHEGLAGMFNQRCGWTRPVVLLPGNHDPLTRTSVYNADHPFRRSLPPWVHVVDRDDFALELGGNAVVYAVPCRSQAGENDPAMRLPGREPGDDRIRIGLVHGQTFDMDGHETNFPIARDAAQQRGLDYLALGDTHGFRQVTRDPPTVYPGAPEPTASDESGAGCVAVVMFLRRGRPVINSERVARWTWRAETCRDLAALRRLAAEHLQDTVLELTLDMRVSAKDRAEVDRILGELKGNEAIRGRAEVLKVDKRLTSAPTAAEDFPDDLPDAVKVTIARLRDQGGETAERALYHLYTLIHSS